MEVCSRRDQNVNGCIANVVNGMKTGLANGRAFEQFSIPPLEPLTVSTIVLKQGGRFEAKFSDVMVNGASNYVIQSMT